MGILNIAQALGPDRAVMRSSSACGVWAATCTVSRRRSRTATSSPPTCSSRAPCSRSRTWARAWASAMSCGQNCVSVGSQSGQHAVFTYSYRTAVCLHAACIAALWEFWTDWLPTETPFLARTSPGQSRILAAGETAVPTGSMGGTMGAGLGCQGNSLDPHPLSRQ
jgi:hypothetical protein